jgi:hypothetical protein
MRKDNKTRSENYKALNNYEVSIGNTVIAKMYVASNGAGELRILQGMPREATVSKLVEDCPDFCRENGITLETYPYLFSATTKN